MEKVTLYNYQPLLTDTATTIAPPAYKNTHPSSNDDQKIAPPPYARATTNAKGPSQSLTIPANRVPPPVTFPSQPALEADFNISEADWTHFTEDLQRAAAPGACQKTLAVFSGIGTAGLILEPWTASLVARWVWHAYTVQNLKKGLDGVSNVAVTEVLKTWNEKWREIGVHVKVDVPELGKKAAKGCGGQGSCVGEPRPSCVERDDCRGKGCCRRRTASDRQQSSCCAKPSGRCGREQRCGAGQLDGRAEDVDSCGRKQKCCAGNEAKRVRIVVEKLEDEVSVAGVDEKRSKDST